MSRLLALLAAGASALLLTAAGGCSKGTPTPVVVAPPAKAPPLQDPPVVKPNPLAVKPPAGDPPVPRPALAPGEAVETLTVKLDVGAGGDELDEPVALDLGLGFPLWLDPLGRKAGESAPFGAVPQQTTATEKVAPGSTATFIFAVKGDPGRDLLRTTPQLLAGVRVADIARIGFTSRGATNWVLAGYEITINDKAFASGKPGVKAAERGVAGAKLADIAAKVAPLQKDLDDLRELIKDNLANDADRKRLAEVEAALPPLLAERDALQGQFDGKSPWFEDREFRAPGRDNPVARSAKVTLVTYDHSGADTQNYVYFRAGSRKYLLGSPATPLTGAAGPQEFSLDLAAGPLAAADLRDWAVGMLAHGAPYAKAPDRWHPQRIVAEVDGRVLYDSDTNDRDRRSLEAIRVIPPAHRDRDGQLVVNVPVARETFLWEAGKGAGLDPGSGAPLPLPGKGDPVQPKAEPLAGVEPGAPVVPPEAPPPEAPPPEAPPPEAPPPEVPPAGIPAPLFAGEQPLPPEVVVVVPPNPGPPGIWDPLPFGPPPQVEQVRITAGWKTSHKFTVTWGLTGAESEVDHYEVALIHVRPASALVYGTEYLLGSAPRGARTFSAFPQGLSGAAPAPRYLAAVVKAIPTATAREQTVHLEIGAARMIFPAGTPSNPFFQPRFGPPFTFQWKNPPAAPWVAQPISATEPAGTARAVWPAGAVVSDNGIRFEAPGRGVHVAARLQVGDSLLVHLRAPRWAFLGQRRLVADLGFLGGPGATGTATATFAWNGLTAAGVPTNAPVILGTKTAVPGGSMPSPFQAVINPALLPATAVTLQIRVRIDGGPFDPAHPPTVFGVRLVPN